MVPWQLLQSNNILPWIINRIEYIVYKSINNLEMSLPVYWTVGSANQMNKFSLAGMRLPENN
jgi:hypothetical protein